MSDRVLFSLMGLAAGLMIALALVWPQGIGARSPGPFGHAPVQQAAAKAPLKGPPPVLTMAPDLSSGPSR
jgi:hypothetical protein